MFQTFISRHNSNFFSDKLVLTSVTPASSAPVLQTPKATSSTLYFDSLTVNAGNGGFLHCIQMDTSVNAANQVDRCIHLNAMKKTTITRSEEGVSRNAGSDLGWRLRFGRKKTGGGRTAINASMLDYIFIFSSPVDNPYLHSFPTRRSSDLTSSTLYFDSLTVNAGNGGFLHCIQMDTSVNAANQVDRCIHLNAMKKTTIT